MVATCFANGSSRERVGPAPHPRVYTVITFFRRPDCWKALQQLSREPSRFQWVHDFGVSQQLGVSWAPLGDISCTKIMAVAFKSKTGMILRNSNVSTMVLESIIPEISTGGGGFS